MRQVLVSVLLIAANSWAECVEVRPIETRRGNIAVLAYDLTGTPITSVHAELIDVESRKVLQTTSTGRLDGVLFGKYIVRISYPGFYTATQELNVDRSDLTVRTQLALGEECGRRESTLTGSVAPREPHRELWLKAIPVRGSGGLETRVRGGYFLLSGLLSGQYLVLVLDGATVLHTQVITVRHGDVKLSIRL
jgi:hypothetical protein